ncbi:unnamed protein product, partial [Heterotrigona itama]
MIEKFTPTNVAVTMFFSWILYSSAFDYRRYRFSFVNPTVCPASTRAREIEL